MDTKQELWKTRIEEWSESGLSRRRFCREGEYSRVSVPSVASPPVAGDGGPLVRVTVGRYTVSLKNGFDVCELGRLFDLLESRCASWCVPGRRT